MNYDFSGWATRNNRRCSDGLIIRKDAFKDNDGDKVPLVWNHCHNSPENVLGHAVLENREDGVYAYCSFNDSDNAKAAKNLVKHGDVVALSIYANKLKKNSKDVVHGKIREVSLVIAGANPGAYIDCFAHSDDDPEEDALIFFVDKDEVIHSEEKNEEKNEESEGKDMADTQNSDKTVKEVFNELTEEQQTVVYALIAAAVEEERKKGSGGGADGEDDMKHNVFDSEDSYYDNREFIAHAGTEIIELAKQSNVGSLQNAIQIYNDTHGDVLRHGFEDVTELFPDHKDLLGMPPEIVDQDKSWVDVFMKKVHRSPFARVRTRQADIREITTLRAKGYTTGEEKKNFGNIRLVKRTTDPQTVYVKDTLNRDDLTDITEFDGAQYIYKVMEQALHTELARAAFIGDGRTEGDDYKISEEHIRPIYYDDELYCRHYDVDVEAALTELQGSNTGQNFGENYVYAEALITAALYSREGFKGTGTPDFYCTPHLLNVMLLARDLNGRRIYDSKADLAKALNVNEIYTVEMFEGITRTDDDDNKKKLLGIFVNLTDYNIGCVKNGQITNFEQFDIDFNQMKYLIETRCSGALTRVACAIALEEPVTTTPPATGGGGMM